VTIPDYLRDDRILLNLQAKTKAAALDEMLGLLKNADEINDPDQFAADVKHRESLASTGVGDGVAFPHARSDAVDKLVVVLGRSEAGLDFDAIDGKPVHLIFLMAAPNADLGVYLKVLARISLMMRRASARDALVAATSTDEVLRVLSQPLV